MSVIRSPLPAVVSTAMACPTMTRPAMATMTSLPLPLPLPAPAPGPTGEGAPARRSSMARLGVMAAKNLRTRVSMDSPAKKSLSRALSAGAAARITSRPAGAPRIWVRFTDSASDQIAESVNQT
jgi:hypothetical protein